MAIDYGCTGPVLRGSGVDQDLRRDGEERYTEMYDGYAFEVIVQKDGHYPRDHAYPPVPSSAGSVSSTDGVSAVSWPAGSTAYRASPPS